MGLENFLDNRITEEDTYSYCITDILRYRAEKTPDEIAYIFLKDGEEDEEKLTYKELYIASIAIAEELQKMKVQGERALMLYPPGLEFVTALYGCFYAGVIAVPAYPPRKNRSLNRIKSIVNDSGASIVLATGQIHKMSIKNFQDVDELRPLQWLETSCSMVSSGHTMKLVNMSQDETALLQYTSGSTGQPKGVMVTHRNIMRNSDYIRQSFSLGRESVSVCWLPSFHDMGLIDGVLQPVFTGFLGVLIPPVAFLQKPSRWLQAITKYGGTHCGGPNFGFDLCVEKVTEEEKRELDLSSLTTFYNGAEPIRRNSLDDFSEAFKDQGFNLNMFYPCYGMAETTLIISGGHATEKPTYLAIDALELEQNKIKPTNDPENSSEHVGVGFGWIDTNILIVDPETKIEIPESNVGEVWVSGSIVAKGYWNNKVTTEETFNAFTNDGRGPFLRTGDLGFFVGKELFIAGRIKDMIIIRGRNYYPQDIEWIVESTQEAIRANCSAAFSIIIDGKEQLAIVAEVERTFIRDLNVEQLCDEIRDAVFQEFELDIYAIQLLRTASIPKTSSGKIQRRACRQGFLEGSLNVVGESVLDNEPVEMNENTEHNLIGIQSWLMAWISTKLNIGIEKIDPSRPIIAYGLNSLKAVQLRNDFMERFGRDFPPYLFFNKMTVAEASEKALELIRESEKDN